MMGTHRDFIMNGKEITSLKKCKEYTKMKEGGAIVTVDLSYNKLVTGEGLEKFINCKSLILDHNSFKTLMTMPYMPKVHILSMNDNLLEDLAEILPILTKNFPKLEDLNLLKNPVCPIFTSKTDYQKFRSKIAGSLPRLIILDGQDVEGKGAGPIKHPLEEIKEEGRSREEVKAGEKKAILNVKKTTIRQTTIDNLSQKILKSHSEGNRFITNNDL